MKRISTVTSVPNKFGAGKNGYTDGDVVGGVPATDLEGLLFDNLQEELANIVEATGVALDGTKLSQVVTALRSNALTTAVDAHAKTQKENVDAYEARLKALDDRGRTVDAELGRVRKQYADYAARDREQASTDPAACQRVADRSQVLAARAARGRELLERGRLVVEGRDNEVQLLLNTVTNDRALLAPGPPDYSLPIGKLPRPQ